MADIIERRTLEKWQKVCAPYEPLSPTKDGYIMDSDGKTLIFRLVLRSEAEKLGMEGLTPEVGYVFANRFANLTHVERAAVDLQRDKFLLRREMAALLSDLRLKKMPPDRAIAKAQQIMNETE